MPNHLPSIDDIVAGNIKFFSLDTSVLHKVGYNFSNEKLLDIYLQLPYQVKLLFPEVVYKEILSHKENDIDIDLKNLESAINTLKRKNILDGELDLSIDSLKEKHLKNIEVEVRSYLEKFDGETLNIKDCNINNIFNDYFNNVAPFENNKSKKNEFPDAVCLHLLEDYAKKHKQYGIIISDDNGWKNFSEKSKYLYYAKSIDEFTELFVAKNDKIAESIRQKIIDSLENDKSELYSKIVSCLDDVYWNTSNIFSENLYSCDADVISHYFNNFSALDINIWKVERESATWILNVNLLFDLELDIEVESYAKDWDDKVLISMGFSRLNIDISPEFQFHIVCSNINIDSDCSDWDMDIKLLNNQYVLDEIGVSYSFE